MELSTEEKVARAERARQILHDELFLEAWDGLEEGAIERIAVTDATDIPKLQALTLSLQTIRAVRRRMEIWIAEGKDAAAREAKRQENEHKVSVFQRFRR
jgi:hypothetical protein